MQQVLNLGRYVATLVTSDFAYWLQEHTFADQSHWKLCTRYSGLCNDRWRNYKDLPDQKRREIGQKLLTALTSAYYNFISLFHAFIHYFFSAAGDKARQKLLQVNIRRSARSAVCTCCMILRVQGKHLRLTKPNSWSSYIKNRIGLLRKKEPQEYSTGVAGKRGVQVNTRSVIDTSKLSDAYTLAHRLENKMK